MISKCYIKSHKLTTKSTSADVLDDYYRLSRTKIELNQKRKRNKSFKIDSASTLTIDKKHFGFTKTRNDWILNTMTCNFKSEINLTEKLNYYDERDDDYESMDDDYYVFNDDVSSCGSLGLYE